MTAAEDFVRLGAQLMALAGQLARSTKGTFAGAAGPALVTITAFLAAGRNGFDLLAADPAATQDQQLAAMQLATQFVQSLGTVATAFGRSGSLASLAPVTAGFGADGLALLFPSAAPPVSVTPAAQAALDALCRDPLTVVQPATASVLALMAAATAGIGIAP